MSHHHRTRPRTPPTSTPNFTAKMAQSTQLILASTAHLTNTGTRPSTASALRLTTATSAAPTSAPGLLSRAWSQNGGKGVTPLQHTIVPMPEKRIWSCSRAPRFKRSSWNRPQEGNGSPQAQDSSTKEANTPSPTSPVKSSFAAAASPPHSSSSSPASATLRS